ncbi:MAG: BTAD domain-containing putative transcriptional regulator [Candidatus Eisenbacteria bacterium]
MKPLTIPEKLQPPPLPSTYLRRPRLERVWSERAQRRLLFVTAGAGYGKTSFLVERTREDSRSALWYRVDGADAHLPTFAAHLGELLGVPAVPVGDSAAPDWTYPQRVAAAVMAALRGRGPTALIVDDAHLLQASSDALQFMDTLARYVPDSITLVLSSREPIALGGMRARTAGRAATIDAHDLSFRIEEITDLLALRLPGVTIAAGQCRRILAATEGWAAGLEIFLQALDAHSPAAIEGALERLDAAGAGWFDYFAEEVVARLPEPTRDFLLRTAVLPRLQPAQCDRFLGRRDSRVMLEELVDRNLFTLRDAPQGQSFRYHHLFHRFLRAWLERSIPDVDLSRLRRRAARELHSTGDIAGALAILAETNDAEASLPLLARHGLELLAAGGGEVVERVLGGLPAERVRRNARALFVQARLHDDRGRWDAAERAYRQLLALHPGKVRRVEVLSDLAQLVSRRGQYARALTLCRQGLGDRRHGSTAAQGRLLWTLGVAACELGRLAEGQRYLEQARALFVRRGEESGEAQVDYLLAANVHLARGEFGLGRETARRALARLRGLGDPRRVCQCLGVLAWLSALAGDVDEAREHATEARRMAESLGLSQAASLALHVLGRCALLDGDLVQARQHLEEARTLGDVLGESDARILPRLLLGECALAAGDRRAARQMADEALAIAMQVKDTLQVAQARALLGLVLAAKNRPAARIQWSRAELTFRRLEAMFDLHRLLLHRLSEDPPAIQTRRRLMSELLEGTARAGHDKLYLVAEPLRAARVLSAALAERIEPVQAAALLARLGERALSSLVPLSSDPREEVRLQVVGLLAQIGGTQARAALTRISRGETERPSARRAGAELARVPRQSLHLETLGSLRVRVGETPIPDARWRSSRARRLFLFLLLQRFRWTTAEEVIEALWPETEVEKARGNLWQSVYQLRRILEPDLAEPRASRYVRVEETGYRLEPGDRCTYDVISFEDAIRKADRLAAAGRARAAEPLYREALDICRGDFLAECPYEDFLVSQREHLRERFIHAAMRLIEICAAGRRAADVIPLCRRALQDDPYNETLYCHLIEAQLRLGHRHEALESYRQVEAGLTGELGLPPSARLRELMQTLRQGPRREP